MTRREKICLLLVMPLIALVVICLGILFAVVLAQLIGGIGLPLTIGLLVIIGMAVVGARLGGANGSR